MGVPIYVQAFQQPVTTVLAVVLVAVFVALHARHLGYADVGLSYDRVVAHRELWRCAVCQLSHLDVLHLLFNLSALWSLGLVERAPGLGSLYYLQQTTLLFILSPAICVLLYHLLIRVARREQYAHVTAVGYSCVLFGWMTLLAVAQPGGITMLPLFGLASIPMWLSPWASLLLTSLLIPKASFVGHLAGMLSGYCLSLGLFSWLTPWWTLSLLAWAALGLGYAAARNQQLPSVPFIRLPGSGSGSGGGSGAGPLGLGLLAGAGGGSSGGGGGEDLEAGTGSGSSASLRGGTRIVGGQIVRG